jgi:hypothetical protein
MAMSRLRAVETGRDVLVTATSGISAVVRADGTVAQQAPEKVARTLVAEVPLRDRQTLATRLGFWPEWLLAAAGLAAAAGVVDLHGPAAAGERSVTGEVPPGNVDGLPAEGLPAEVVRGEGVLVIVPTYQERLNVENIVGRVRASVPMAHVLVVDDASPDGTGALADALAATDAHVHVLHRAAKEGLGVGLPGGVRVGARARLRGPGRDGRRTARTSRAAPAPAGRAARRRPGAGLAVGAGRLGGQLAGPAEALSQAANVYVRKASGSESTTPPAATARSGGARWRSWTSRASRATATASRWTSSGGPCSRACG